MFHIQSTKRRPYSLSRSTYPSSHLINHALGEQSSPTIVQRRPDSESLGVVVGGIGIGHQLCASLCCLLLELKSDDTTRQVFSGEFPQCCLVAMAACLASDNALVQWCRPPIAMVTSMLACCWDKQLTFLSSCSIWAAIRLTIAPIAYPAEHYRTIGQQ